MPFESRLAELIRCGAGQSQPALLGRRNIRAFMDLHPVDQPVPINACCVEEAKEEHDQPWFAVHEDDAVVSEVGLVLGALAPVGDSTRDEEFPLGQRADLGGCGGACGLPPLLADAARRCPVALDALRCPLAELLVAEPVWPGQVSDPERDRAFETPSSAAIRL